MVNNIQDNRPTLSDLGFEKGSRAAAREAALLGYRRRSSLLTPLGWLFALALIAIMMGSTLAFVT
jgi:hypothetical protein